MTSRSLIRGNAAKLEVIICKRIESDPDSALAEFGPILVWQLTCRWESTDEDFCALAEKWRKLTNPAK